MSKHPTSHLTPRDIACIEYGRELEYLLCYKFPYRHDEDYTDFDEVLKIVRKCRALRKRIFRLCGFCKHTGHGGSSWCEHAQDYVHMKEDLACTCPHYKERRHA